MLHVCVSAWEHFNVITSLKYQPMNISQHFIVYAMLTLIKSYTRSSKKNDNFFFNDKINLLNANVHTVGEIKLDHCIHRNYLEVSIV